MPAEWEPQAAIWLSWPHKRASWPGHFRPIPYKFAEIVATISRFQDVRINAALPLQRRARALVAKAGADLKRVTFYNHPTNDAWCRDHGPCFILRETASGRREQAVVDWGYNAWGGKYPPFDSDDVIPTRIAERFRLRVFHPGIVMEGGTPGRQRQGHAAHHRELPAQPQPESGALAGADRAAAARLPGGHQDPLAGRRASRGMTPTGTSMI
jgi:agmatine deiminase